MLKYLKTKTSDGRRRRTNATIDLIFRQFIRSPQTKLYTKFQPPVRLGTPGRRPLPVWYQIRADAERQRTARRKLYRSFLESCPTISQSFIEIDQAVRPLRRLEHRVKTPQSEKRQQSAPTASRLEKFFKELQHRQKNLTKTFAARHDQRGSVFNTSCFTNTLLKDSASTTGSGVS